MGEKFQMDPGDVGKGYDRLPDSLDSGKLTDKFADRKHWIVKLEFLKDKKSFGTGFFLNVPESSYDVILTAGHNLITEDKKKVRDLKAYISMPTPIRAMQKPSAGSGIETVSIDQDYIHICSDFENNPVADANKINDWGAILLPNPRRKRPGFGFNLQLGFKDFGKDVRALDKLQMKDLPYTYTPHVGVTGYRFGDRPGDPLERHGNLFIEGEERLRVNQLEYNVDTEEGMSGSPVWTANRGGECVIAIHNQGRRSRERGSRGTRLNEHVLRQIFEWAEAKYTSKALKIYHPKAPGSGVYFHLRQDDPEVCIIIGPGQDITKFDLLPAHAPPGASRTAMPLYALYYTSPTATAVGQWVRWRKKKEIAELYHTLMDDCLFEIRSGPKEEGFKFVFSRPATTEEMKNAGGVSEVLIELRVDISLVTDDDIRRGDNIAEDFIRFDEFFKSNQTEFNQFQLE